MIGPGGLLNVIEQEVFEIEKHIHNREIWFGNGAVEDSLTPYTIISGNNDFGAAVLLLDSGDTPVDAGMIKFDPHKTEVISVDTNSEYLLRLIWGSGTVGDAETAKQYTTFPATPSGIGANVSGDPIQAKANRIICGTDKVWMKCKNASNLAEILIQLGIHEYPR